jgi:hypothetical protein
MNDHFFSRTRHGRVAPQSLYIIAFHHVNNNPSLSLKLKYKQREKRGKE